MTVCYKAFRITVAGAFLMCSLLYLSKAEARNRDAIAGAVLGMIATGIIANQMRYPSQPRIRASRQSKSRASSPGSTEAQAQQASDPFANVKPLSTTVGGR